MGTVNTWPGWEHVRELGAGSFGKVHEIRREDHGKTYRAALKVITIPSSQSEIREAYNEGMSEQNVTEYFQEFVENITEEFALMSEFKGQSNIVSYEDHKVIKHEDGIGWDILIRMEMLTPLSDWGSGHPLNEADVIAMGRDICHALELCWQKRIIHRDIKPENIFVSDYGDYKLGDFGIARTSEKTRANLSQKGTYAYIAPEVYKGQEYGRTADIYSLGMVLYRYLNENRLPFMPLDGTIRYNDREDAFKRRICGEQIPPPIRGSRALKEVVLKALAYAPEERYQSAGEFRKALEGCVKEIEDSSEGTMMLFPDPKKYTEDEDTSGRKTRIIRQELPEETRPQEETKQQGGKRNKTLIISAAGIVGLVLLVCVIISAVKRPEPVPELPDTTEVSTEPDSAEATPDNSGQSGKKYAIKVFNRSDMSQLYRDEFADSVYFGRSSENDIMLDDSTVSRRHCRITNKNGRFFVEDLKSTNGTFVNGKKIDGEVEVFPNVTISIGMGSEELIVLFEAVKAVPETTGEDDTSDAGGDMQLYRLDDIGLAVKMPSGYRVVTRGEKTETDRMIADDIYLLAEYEDYGRIISQIIIRCYEGSYPDLRRFSEDELKEQAKVVEQGCYDAGYTVIDCDVYKSGRTNFIKYYNRNEENGIIFYGLHYVTWSADKYIKISFPELTPSEKNAMQGVIDSIIDSMFFTDKSNTDVKN